MLRPWSGADTDRQVRSKEAQETTHENMRTVLNGHN